MSNGQIAIIVPKEVGDVADVLLEAFRSSLSNSKADSKDAVEIIRSSATGFGATEVYEIILVIGKGAVLWLTKKWIEEYLWIAIKKLIDKPSKELIDWLFSLPEKVIQSEEE
jgi:hypothetical protein